LERSNWKVDSEWLKLSITKNGNLLVACWDLKKLIEYTSTGIMVREIVLQADSSDPHHAIQLDNDQFVVSLSSTKLHRVCIVDNKGQIIKSYGRDPGSQEGQMNGPCNLAVDPSGCILVADVYNNRIIKFKSRL
jgi:hypothetical protein